MTPAGAIPLLDPEAEREELQSYLGDRYNEDHLRRGSSAVMAEFAELGDEQALYRRSTAYLYDLTAFAMTGTKEPYLRDLAKLAPPPARLLDYGCGIGSDGLRLLAAGYDVSFADFGNPSVEYLRWRLDRRGFQATVYDLDRDEIPRGFDLAYSFDVLEHVDDPFEFLTALEDRSALVLVNLLEDDEDEPPMHRSLPIPALVRHAANLDLRHYRIYHRRSHLVGYGTARRGPARRLSARARILAGRLRR